jgi:hypothetical protein
MGTSFLNLKNGALLLFLCDRGAKHRWSRIKWLNDVAGLLAQERSFSWENILALADRFDLSLALAQADMLVHWLYGVPLPQPCLYWSRTKNGPFLWRPRQSPPCSWAKKISLCTP